MQNRAWCVSSVFVWMRIYVHRRLGEDFALVDALVAKKMNSISIYILCLSIICPIVLFTYFYACIWINKNS